MRTCKKWLPGREIQWFVSFPINLLPSDQIDEILNRTTCYSTASPVFYVHMGSTRHQRGSLPQYTTDMLSRRKTVTQSSYIRLPGMSWPETFLLTFFMAKELYHTMSSLETHLCRPIACLLLSVVAMFIFVSIGVGIGLRLGLNGSSKTSTLKWESVAPTRDTVILISETTPTRTSTITLAGATIFTVSQQGRTHFP